MAVKAMIRRAAEVGIFICTLAVLAPAVGQASTLPAVEQLTGITMDRSRLWGPGRLSTGHDGALYVVDSLNNHILKFDRNGNLEADLGFPRPSAVAAAPDGTLYVGSHLDYAVTIVKNGKVAGMLGKGKNEFRSIRDIAYDAAAGRIYVVDNVGNAVRVFDAAGRDLGSIDGVNLPIGIEVTAEAIYIIDAPIVQEQGSLTTSSRISIFDKAYTPIGTIDDYGKDQIFRPTDIAVADGILYVTDAALQSVVLFDASGKYLGEIQSIAGEMRTAVSLAISADSILYVSSSETHSIQMFDLAAGGVQ